MDNTQTQLDDEIEIDLWELFQILLKNWLWILLSTLGCAILGLLITMFLITPKYRAEATMIVNTRQDQTATVTNDQITSAQKLVDTYSIIIRSRRVVDPIMEKLNIEADYESFVKNIIVESVNDTQVMSIQVENKDPEIALQVVQEIVDRAPGAIISTVEAGSVNVVSEPYVNSEVPVSPSKLKNTAIAAFIGLFISSGAFLLIAFLDNTFKSEEDIQKQLGLVTIGIIPTTESCKRRCREWHFSKENTA